MRCTQEPDTGKSASQAVVPLHKHTIIWRITVQQFDMPVERRFEASWAVFLPASQEVRALLQPFIYGYATTVLTEDQIMLPKLQKHFGRLVSNLFLPREDPHQQGRCFQTWTGGTNLHIDGCTKRWTLTTTYKEMKHENALTGLAFLCCVASVQKWNQLITKVA